MTLRPDTLESILKPVNATEAGRGTAPAPFAPGPDISPGHVPDYDDPVLNWAEQRARQQQAQSRRDFVKNLVVAGSTSMACLGGTAAWVHYKLDFQTDFSEPNASLLWQTLDRGRLFIERFGGRSSGVPAGAHLLAPSVNMANSEAFLLASVDERPAEFIFRAHSQQDCYRLRLSRRTKGSAQPMLSVEVLKRRNGRETILWPGEERTGPIVFPYSMATVQVEMDGVNFAVYLRKPYSGNLAGIPRFEGLDRRLLAHWTDGEFRDGLLGMWGPDQRARDARTDFRVFTVGLRA